MRVVIAPDSFKGSLSAKEVGSTILKALTSEVEGVDAAVVPMADGGEGTLEALVDATEGMRIDVRVSGPLLRPIHTHYGVLGDEETAVVEVAQIAGLTQVPEAEKNPLNTSSYGVGEAILHALNQGYRKFMIALGGSAVNDGGVGLLQALGASFSDRSGRPVRPVGGSLAEIVEVSMDTLDPRLSECDLWVANDVSNPLCGERGCSAVFGPQKGATKSQVRQLDSGLRHVAGLLEACMGRSLQHEPGAGAAGGLGFALLLLGARMEKGARIVADIAGLERKISGADWVITGEGRTDEQTAYGKLPYFVAQMARRHGAKPLLLSGSIGEGAESLYETFVSLHSILRRPVSLQEAIENAESLLYETSRDIARLIGATGSENTEKRGNHV
ncbi:glycerate kinase [Paludifilum halophilum]|uniref:Glycerate kinase n=1 Tax=Paludifilum halophilum TaxID=1642702 RepID=A0A235B5M5_9BACL|nr:glycerate kinase [Paludifilum halophilum]OYD07604.1 glycerate kinase [Paludifilum halophilum]